MPKFVKTGDWKRYARVLDPKVFGPALERHVAPALIRAGLQAQARIRKGVREKILPANSALTILIKKSSTPLVDHGDLIRSVVAVQKAWNIVFVGVLKNSAEYNVAVAVHDGVVITVTDRMRLMFKYLWLVGQGKMDSGDLSGRAAELWARAPGAFWRPLKDDTQRIVIPPRPFIHSVMRSHATKTMLGRFLVPAIRLAIIDAGGTP